MSLQKQELEILQRTEKFFKTVEAGDLSLYDIFPEAIAIFGFTKVGKTSSCHILSNNSPLKAESHNGELIYKPTSPKYSSAVVGITTESETQIPNIFETKFRDKNNAFKSIVLLDQPGYGDTYGFHRIFSNGYFHYRTFSKTPKLKFILAMKKAHLADTGEKFKNTILNFLNTFTRYDQIKKNIMEATTFLITQVEPKNTIENIKGVIAQLRDESVKSMTKEERERYQEFINHMLTNNKVFLIEKPEQAGIQTKQTDILKQIYEKTTFWERQVHHGVTDMSQINFSCGAQILQALTSYKSNTIFRLDFDHFMKYTQDRINKILLAHEFSLSNIVEILKKDAIGPLNSHRFLESMAQFVSIFYKFNESLKVKRQKTEASLFTSNQHNEAAENGKNSVILAKEGMQAEREYKEKEMRQVYFIKKYRVLQFIKERTKGLETDSIKRSVYWLQSVSTFFNDLFKKFSLLKVEKEDERLIYRYSYVIQRLIEEAKITTLILFSDEGLRKKFDQYKENMVDIFRPLKDRLFVQFEEIQIQDLKEEFVNRVDFSKFEIVNKDIIEFFESVAKKDKKIRNRLADLVIRYGETINKKNIKAEEKTFIIVKLFNYRNQFYEAMLKQQTKNQKVISIEKIILISNMLGQFLLDSQLYKEAREVFLSINNADQVFKIYEAELAKTDKNSLGKSRSLLLEYGRSAGFFRRQELALKCFQEAYSKSQNYQELKEVGSQIIELSKPQDKDKEDPYLAKFFRDEFCSPLPEGVRNTIQALEFRINVSI